MQLVPGRVYREADPVWVATEDPALPWRVQTNQYTCDMAGYLDAGIDGVLWRFEHRLGHVMTYSPEAVAYVDHLGYIDPLVALDHIEAVVSGDTITFDHPGYAVTYQALHDRLKLTITLKVPFRAPDGSLVNTGTAILTLTGGVVLPNGLDIWDLLGQRIEDFATMGEVYLRTVSGEDVQHLARVTAIDANGNHGAGELRIVTDLDGTRRLYQGIGWAWLQVATYPVEIDPTVIATSTNSSATAYPNQRKIDRFTNGVLFGLFHDGSNMVCRYSSDSGATWNSPTAGTTVASGINYGSCFIDADNYIHVVYGTGANLVKYVRGTPDAGRTGYTWSAVTDVDTSSNANYPHVVAHAEGTGWKAHVVHSVVSGTINYAVYQRIDITSGGTISLDGTAVTLGGSYGSSVSTLPSVTADSSKNLYISWSAGVAGSPGQGIRFKKAPYSAGAWTFGSEEEVRYTAHAGTQGMGPVVLDSTGRAYVTWGAGTVFVWRRSTGGIWTDISPSAVSGTDPTVTIDSNDDLYVFYCDAALKYRRYSGGSWDAAVTADATTTSAIPSARRNTDGSAVDVLYLVGAVLPRSVTHYRLSLNTAPTAPTLTTRTNFDATASAAFAWTFNDSDSGDAQSAYQLIIIRVSDSVTVLDTGKVASTTASYTLTSSTLVNPNQYQWKVRTYDNSDTVSPYSDLGTFYASAKPSATITVPATDGATVTGSSLTAEWSFSDPESEGQSAYQVRLTDNSDVELWTSGKVASVSARSLTIGYTLVNGTSYKVKITVWDAKDVAGTQVVRTFTTSFTAPAAPTITATGDNSTVSITVAWVNPAPTGSQPAVASNEVYRRIQGGASWTLLDDGLPSNSSYVDYAPGSGKAYEYQVVAIGTNSSEQASEEAEAQVDFNDWWFCPVDADDSDLVRLAYNSQVSWRVDEDVRVPAIQAKYRRQYRGPTFNRIAEVSAVFNETDTLTAQEVRELVLTHIEDGTVGYLKSPVGDVWKGVLQAPSGQIIMPAGWESVRCQFRETGVAP